MVHAPLLRLPPPLAPPHEGEGKREGREDREVSGALLKGFAQGRCPVRSGRDAGLRVSEGGARLAAEPLDRTAMSQARLSALALVVPDYDAAIAFYVGVMGFRLVEDIDQGRKRWVTVEPPGGGVRLVLARAEGAAQAAAIGNQAGGRVFLFLATDDFDRDHARMRAAGVAFEEEPRDESYGRVAVWRDPFGNRWDLIGPASA